MGGSFEPLLLAPAPPVACSSSSGAGTSAGGRFARGGTTEGPLMSRQAFAVLLAALTVLGAWPTQARASGGAFYRCRITNGQVFSCDGSWYQGKAVVKRGDGSYYRCTIVNGDVFSCDGTWYQGKAVVKRDDGYHRCEIVNGSVFSCDGPWYQGDAVLRRRD
ncbi:MAG: hypothetical protein ACYDCL_23930 [Myxococcales bacterium]